jgi:long-chain acyl-CoA synthetase
VGGRTSTPRRSKDVLASDPAVLEAAVIGVPDETWGEVVVAFVQARPGATVDVDALQARCREKLGGYKRPKQIHVLEALPKSAVGKLDKRSLRDSLTHA